MWLHIINLKTWLIVLEIEIHWQRHREFHLKHWIDCFVQSLLDETIKRIYQWIFHNFHNEILSEQSISDCMIQCEMFQIVKIFLFGAELEVRIIWFHSDNIIEALDHEFHNIEVYEAQTLDAFTINEWIIVLFTLEANSSYTKTHNSFSRGIIQSQHLERHCVFDDEQRGETTTIIIDTKADLFLQKINEVWQIFKTISTKWSEDSDYKQKHRLNGAFFLWNSIVWFCFVVVFFKVWIASCFCLNNCLTNISISSSCDSI